LLCLLPTGYVHWVVARKIEVCSTISRWLHKISGMNLEIRELDRQIAELQARRDELFKEYKSQAIQTARQLVEQYGLTPIQVGLGSISRNPLPPSTKRPTTFYDPNRGLSWDGSLAGRGRKPAWIVKAIEDKTIEFFRVQLQSAQPTQCNKV